MKSITSILLLVLAVAAGVILFIVMSGNGQAPKDPAEVAVDPALPAEEQAALVHEARLDAARSTCHDALLVTLDEPDSARFEPASEWPIKEPPDGTVHVRLSAQITTAMGMEMDGTWDCVVLPEGAGMRLVTLTLVDR